MRLTKEVVAETGNLHHLATVVTPGEQRTRPPVVDVQACFTEPRVILPTEDACPGREEGRKSVLELSYTGKLKTVFNEGLSDK